MGEEILEILQKYSNNENIIQSGLKSVDSLFKSNSDKSKNPKQMENLVSLMEKHANSKQILNGGALILGKIATKEDMNKCLKKMKEGN